MKQTAVEWYSNAVNNILIARQDNKIDNELLIQNLLNAKLQAKGMEKEQINKAFYDGYYQEGMYDARKYYEDNFKSE